LKGKETIEKSVFENLQEQVNQLKEMGTQSITVKTLVEEIKENKEALKNIAKGGNAEVVLKADTLRASIATNPHVELVDGIGQLQRKKRSLYDLFRKIPVGAGNHNGTIAYVDWDEATTVKAAASVAEGVAFAESTAKFKGYTLALQKIGDSLPVSEEFFNDEVQAAAELDMFLEAPCSSSFTPSFSKVLANDSSDRYRPRIISPSSVLALHTRLSPLEIFFHTGNKAPVRSRHFMSTVFGDAAACLSHSARTLSIFDTCSQYCLLSSCSKEVP